MSIKQLKSFGKILRTKPRHVAIALCIVAIAASQQGFAQESVNASGGKAAGSGGTISYSVGQVAFSLINDISGSVMEGVQIPYEIYVITGTPDIPGDISVVVFPNPSEDFLKIRVNEPKGAMNIRMYNMDGKLVKSGEVISTETTINLGDLPASTYILKLSENNREIKTYKIIKK